jgi:hypothetical protein
LICYAWRVTASTPGGVLASFGSTDIDVATHLSIEFAKLDNAEFVRLQQATFSPGATEADAEALEAFLPESARSATILEALAGAWARVGREDVALQRRQLAMTVTPTWDRELSARLLNNVAYGLLVSGEYATGLAVSRTALRYDPYSPYVLSTLASLTLRCGDAPGARRVDAYLREAGYPADFWLEPSDGDETDAVASAAFDPARVEYVPASDVDVFRCMVAAIHDSNRNEPAKHLGLALALAAAGQPLPAYFAAVSAPESDPVTARHLAQLAHGVGAGLPAQLRAEVDARTGIWGGTPDDRETALVGASTELLWAKVFDPDNAVRMAACKALAVQGVRQELLPLVELSYELEQLTGRSIIYDATAKPHDLLPVLLREPIRLRGVALVDAVIERVRRGDGDIKVALPDPVPPQALDALTFPGGVPLPPSLRRWLAFDASWLEAECAYWGGASDPVFRTGSIGDAVRETLETGDSYVQEAFTFEQFLDATALPLDYGSESVRMLVLTNPDEHGEYPVMCADIDDVPCMYLTDLGFDTWLAGQAGLIADVEVDYEAEMDALRARLGEDEDFGFTAGFLNDPDAEEYELLDGASPDWDADEDDDDSQEDEDEDEDEEHVHSAEPVVPRPIPLPDDASAEWFGEALPQAMRGRDQAKVRYLFDEALRRYPSEQGWLNATLVAWEIGHGEALLQDLLAAGADPNTPHTYGTVLHTAASFWPASILRLMLDHGGDPMLRNGNRQTPLHCAADHMRLENMELLLARGSQATAVDKDGRTPLWESMSRFYASKSTWQQQIQTATTMLLAAGADPNAERPDDHSTLHRAVDIDHAEAVSLLLAHGADVMRRNYTGDTPIQHAWRDQRWGPFDVLRAAGCAADTVNANGWSLDQVTSGDGRSPRLVDIQVGDGSGEHELNVAIDVVYSNGYGIDARELEQPLRLLQRLSQAGALGLHRFVPGSSRADWDAPAFEVAPTSTGQPPRELFRIEGTYRLRNVPPAAVGLWLRALSGRSYRIATLVVRSSQTPQAGPGSIRWPVDPLWSEIRPWVQWPVRVADARAVGRLCVVTADPGLQPAIAAAMAEVASIAVDVRLPDAPIYLQVARNGLHLMFNTMAYPKRQPPIPQETVDVLRALVSTALAGVSIGAGGAEIDVEWSLGATGPDSTHDASDFEPTLEDE